MGGKERRTDGRTSGRAGSVDGLTDRFIPDNKYFLFKIFKFRNRRPDIEVYVGLPQVLETNFMIVPYTRRIPPAFTFFPMNISLTFITFHSIEKELLPKWMNK